MADVLASMLAILQRRKTALGTEAAQQLHHVVIMFRRRITDTEYPVEQIGVGATGQRLKSPELTGVQSLEEARSERAENEVAFLRSAMPAPKQEAPARRTPGCSRSVACGTISSSNLDVLVENRCCDALQCCILMLIGAPDGIIMFAFISAVIHIVPATTTNTMRTPKASASTLLVLSGPLVMCRKNTR